MKSNANLNAYANDCIRYPQDRENGQTRVGDLSVKMSVRAKRGTGRRETNTKDKHPHGRAARAVFIGWGMAKFRLRHADCRGAVSWVGRSSTYPPA